MIRLAIALLFTTGIRRGELLALKIGDYNPRESTLHIRETKFYKSRLLPINGSIAAEMDQCLRARSQRKLPVSRIRPSSGTPPGVEELTAARVCDAAIQPLLQKCGIVTAKGKLPRIHDFRHSFAVNALLRWYRAGADVEAKLPLLATYLGHGSAVSTHYYLHFIEPLRTAASERFANRYGELVSPLPTAARRRAMKTGLPNLLGAAIRDYFTDHLPRLRGTSPHTIHSYRDSIVLLLRFLSRQRNKPVTGLDLTDLDPPGILAFLAHLEQERNNGVSTRNVRLSAIHAFFHFVAARNPEHLELAQRVLGIPFKRARQRAIDYLEYEEIDAILKAINRATLQGSRDYALLATMFNTGGRVQEIAELRACDLQLTKPFQVRLFGKGRKERYCPLWPQTAAVLRAFCHQRNLDLRSESHLFLNHRGQPLTRFGIRHILARCLGLAYERAPNLRKKRLHPHSVRHSTAVALLKSGVDLSTISHLLGHASPTTTNRYAKVDLEMKRQAIAKVKPVPRRSRTPWSKDRTILDWLESL